MNRARQRLFTLCLLLELAIDSETGGFQTADRVSPFESQKPQLPLYISKTERTVRETLWNLDNQTTERLRYKTLSIQHQRQ